MKKLTADEEEPICERCDNFCESEDFCIETCGAYHFWNSYERTVEETE